MYLMKILLRAEASFSRSPVCTLMPCSLRMEMPFPATRGLLAVMAAWLQSHIHRRPFRTLTAGSEGIRLGMQAAECFVPPPGDYPAVLYYHSPDHGVRRHMPCSPLRKGESLFHISDVFVSPHYQIAIKPKKNKARVQNVLRATAAICTAGLPDNIPLPSGLYRRHRNFTGSVPVIQGGANIEIFYAFFIFCVNLRRFS